MSLMDKVTCFNCGKFLSSCECREEEEEEEEDLI